jgi:hypothetical protein
MIHLELESSPEVSEDEEDAKSGDSKDEKEGSDEDDSENSGVINDLQIGA